MPLPGTNTGSAPGFLTTTARLCAGTKILTEIYDSSPARAIWRFFLLTILCAIMASVVGTFVQKGVFERAGRNLDEEIGAFVVTPETISVQKEPDTPRRFKLPYITLEYYPGNTFASEADVIRSAVVVPVERDNVSRHCKVRRNVREIGKAPSLSRWHIDHFTTIKKESIISALVKDICHERRTPRCIGRQSAVSSELCSAFSKM